VRSATYAGFVAKPEGKGPLERPRRRWKDNIILDFQNVLRGID
jgi:hypothetical protein